MKKTNVLVVEDESIVAMEIANYVQKLDYNVLDICSNAEDSLKYFEDYTIEIVLMDICIKGEMDGIETAKEIKKISPNTEIIFLTAHMDDYNVDRAIEINPTAYLSKPFNREELRVFLKIAQHKINNKTFDIQKDNKVINLDEEFSYNTENSSLYCCNEMIKLTQKESNLLELLLKNKNNIVDFYTIETHIWPDKETNTNTIRTLVKRLRQKLKHKFIKTVFSRGYQLNLDIST